MLHAVYVPPWFAWSLLGCLVLGCVGSGVALFFLWRWHSALMLGYGMMEVFKELLLGGLRQWQKRTHRTRMKMANYEPHHKKGWLSYVIPLPLLYHGLQIVLVLLSRYSHIGTISTLLQQAETFKAFLGALGVLKSFKHHPKQ
jgi:hypothetical protein